MLNRQKGQAIIELAVLGSLVIMAFSIVIGLSENYNRRQSYMQQTFRATLYKAQDANDTGSVSAVDFRRLPNVTNPMEVGAFQQYSSGNSVIWSDGKRKGGSFGEWTEAKQYFLRDRSAYELIATGASGTSPGSTSVSSSGYTTSLGSNSSYDKNESGNSNINTTKDLGAHDGVSGWATVGDKTVGTSGTLSAGGLYYGGGFGRHTNNTRE